ncbi:hypothetical protein PsorP6_012081 [Peronosclerospora sorghi]|uniref:Uncharacterized protein n=1 Tax=Peronosclerospora sorghi TaxID=230839 RepID=A0ACC0WHF0_9STRA|nr:hypothetical protein PsorP6_012081 [Peronosclerospora sorghi]
MDDFSSLLIIFYTVLFNLIEQVSIGIALVVAVWGALYLWHQSVANLGSTKMLRDFNLVLVMKLADTELALLGNFKSDRHKKAAVLIIQTATMDTQIPNQLIVKMTLHKILMNDIYNTFLGDVSRDVKPYKVNLIYPATVHHVRKHTDQNFYMVVETKEAYRKITNPYIDSIPPDSIDWFYNILEQARRTEFYEDIHPRNGFVLLPDIKWSDLSQISGTLSSLYVFPANSNTTLEVLHRKFGVNASFIRMYLQHQPTYYHLHVHFSHVKMTQGTYTGKAVLLEDVINNLCINSDHYEKATLSYVIGARFSTNSYSSCIEKST